MAILQKNKLKQTAVHSHLNSIFNVVSFLGDLPQLARYDRG